MALLRGLRRRVSSFSLSLARAGALAGLAFLASNAVGCSSDDGGDDDDDAGEGGEAGENSGATGGSGARGGSGNRGGSSGQGGSGGGNTPAPELGELVPAAEAEWTVLVYGHGDHNLSNSLLVDLREMAQAELGAAGTVQLLVLTDWDASQVVPGTNERFPAGVQLFRIPGGARDLEVVAEDAEQNFDDPAVLASVVRDVFRAFPARRRGVILWDHGGAWSGGFGSDTQNGTVARPVAMPAQAVPAALRAGLEAAGVSAEPALDFVAFDTCLMAGAEVAYPFRGLAGVYIANAEIDYGAGWDYTASLSYLAANPQLSAREFAAAEVGHWDAHHASASANDALLRSHAALDLTRLEAFGDAAAAFTQTLAGSSEFDAIELGRGGFFSLPPYASQFENAASSLPGLRDAGQLFDALAETSSDPDVAAKAASVREALDELVIDTSQGVLREAASQAGVHVELSLASELTPAKTAEYAQSASEWSQKSGWPRVLEAIMARADSEPPAFEHAVRNAEGASASAPPVLELSTADADVAQGAVYLGEIVGSETVVLLGLIGSGLIEADAAYEFAWDGAVLTFPDGQPAMLDRWLDAAEGSEPVLMVPGVLDGAASEQLITYLVFTPSEGGASAAVVSFGNVASTLSLAEIAEAAPTATFSPLYHVIDATTGESSLTTGDPMPIPASGYRFSTAYAPAGPYVLFTGVTDVWGNQALEGDTLTLLEPLGP